MLQRGLGVIFAMNTRFHRKKLEQFRRNNTKVRTSKIRTIWVNSPSFMPFSELDKEEGERVTQGDIIKNVDVGSATKHFSLKFKGGPYSLDYSRNARFLAFCGKSGHIGAFDWMTKKPLFEAKIGEECSDIKFLHQETMIAVAQHSYTYIYDNQGLELHCLKRLNCIKKLEFLIHHFILVAGSANGFLYYLDASIGEIVASYPTHLGSLNVLKQVPSSGVITTGHPSGCICFWTPSVAKSPVAKIFAHSAPVKALAADGIGNYLASSGGDRKLRLWDLRNTLQPVIDVDVLYSGPVTSLDFSQRGLLAMASGSLVQVNQNGSNYGNNFATLTRVILIR
ncbi:unnamed protein product [Protopolystoma xenopodis]|uniref:Uncharacterized protein n=1 Tax=Protopolystoma xenopodis TaxID=117903 RepID=A0A448XGD3_9PLAT|nr:unnamed protein product [Protopolystoma xenopodis]